MKEEDLNKIKMWYYKSEIDHFSSFTTLWIAFNAFYNVKFREGSNRKNIKEFVKDVNLKEIYVALLKSESNFKIEVQDLKKELDKKPLYNDKGSGRSSITGRDYPINVENIQNMDQLVDVLYTIRNNLFHGDKSLLAERDQRLVELAYKILHQYLGKLLSKETGGL